MDSVTLTAMAGVPGAAMVTVVLVQVIKMLTELSNFWTRFTVIITAASLLLIANLIVGLTADPSLDGKGWAFLIPAVLVNGLFAGLAAMKSWETLAHGPGHQVQDS